MKHAVNDGLYFRPQMMDVGNLVQDGQVMDVYLKNLDYTDVGSINSIELAEKSERDSVQIGDLIKVIVNWPIANTYQERFWVEVIKVTLDSAGSKFYWGRVYSFTQVANYGDLIGPIQPHNVAAIQSSYYMTAAEAA